MTEYIPLLTSLITAIAAVITTIIVNIGTRKEVKQNLLRIQILSPELPIMERMRLYDEYVKLGGNGYMRSYFDTVLKPLCDAETRRLESFKDRRANESKS